MNLTCKDPRLLAEVKRNIAHAIEEDKAYSDSTTAACIAQEERGIATLLLKEKGTLAGLPFLPLITKALDPTITVTPLATEGARLGPAAIAELKGPICSLLAVERTLLNFVQHATSIASTTACYVDEVQGRCAVLDTRKTLPGYRFLQKYAVGVGGGENHRFDLAQQILIKDNHLAYAPLGEAIERARQHYPDKRVEVEVENLQMFTEALAHRPDAILLDNMSPAAIAKAVQQGGGAAFLEASGGITLETIHSYAETGVDGISVGALTHSIQAVDMSIEIRRA